MVTILSLLALVLSVLAIILAVDARTPERAVKKAPVRNKETRAQRERLETAKRENRNFMHFDGAEQMPIDPNTILAARGE